MYQVRVQNKIICVMVCLIKCPETHMPWCCYMFSGVKILVNKVTVWRVLLCSAWPAEPAEDDAEDSQYPSTSITNQIQTEVISQGPCVDEWQSLQDYTDSASVFSLINVTRPPRSLTRSAPFGVGLPFTTKDVYCPVVGVMCQDLLTGQKRSRALWQVSPCFDVHVQDKVVTRSEWSNFRLKVVKFSCKQITQCKTLKVQTMPPSGFYQAIQHKLQISGLTIKFFIIFYSIIEHW